MKKMNSIYRIYTVIFCLVLMLSGFPTSVFAAKEMFSTYEITDVTITGIDAPEAGKYFDFTAEEKSQKYNIIKVAWMQEYSGKYIMDTSAVVSSGVRYTAVIVLEVASPDHHFKTGEGRVSAVPSVSVNGQTANANNTFDYELFMPDASKYEHDTTYQRYLTVYYTFPEVPESDLIESFEVVIDPPISGELPAKKAVITTVNGSENVGFINVDDIVWSYQDGRNLPSGTAFEYGENYTVALYLRAVRSRKYATDPNHFFASPGNPFTAVTATINGKTATVLPNGDAETSLVVSVVMPCDKIGLSAETPFQPSEPEVHPDFNGNRISSVEKHICSPIKVEKAEETCTTEGKNAHYFCPECGKFFEDSKCTKEITDINTWGVIPASGHSGGKATCVERAKCKICGMAYGDFAGHNYGTAWDYKDANGHAHTCKVCGTHDTVQPHSGGTAACGKVAKCAECKAEYGGVMEHKWSVSWDYKDAKGHAHKCTVCGDHDAVMEHSGGTADCQNKAKCSVCGEEYGKIGDHKWSTTWDYISVSGHAHTCTISGCDKNDTVVKHTPGTAATETSSQNCTVCNYVIEPAKKHEHKLTKVAAVDASCTTAGKKQYYVCDGCGKLFSDAKGTMEITDQDSLIVPASGHKESKWKSDADIHWKECTVKGCGIVIEGTNVGHEFGKNDKCTVCGFKRDSKPAEVPSPIQIETDAPETEEVPETKEKDETDSEKNDPPEDQTLKEPDDAVQNGEEPLSSADSGSNTVLLIITAASVILAAVCMIVMTVVLLKKNKRT